MLCEYTVEIILFIRCCLEKCFVLMRIIRETVRGNVQVNTYAYSVLSTFHPLHHSPCLCSLLVLESQQQGFCCMWVFLFALCCTQLCCMHALLATEWALQRPWVNVKAMVDVWGQGLVWRVREAVITTHDSHTITSANPLAPCTAFFQASSYPRITEVLLTELRFKRLLYLQITNKHGKV